MYPLDNSKLYLMFRHYEKNGLAYCYYHYHQLFGSLCYHCNGVIQVQILIWIFFAEV